MNGTLRQLSLGSKPPIVLVGVAFDFVTIPETVRLIEEMVALGQPQHLVTANVDFLCQALRDAELHQILVDAHLVLCDGTPLVWASRGLGHPLPERVAGSDLVPLLIKSAARNRFKVFLLGGAPESNRLAVENLKVNHCGLDIVGYAPPFTSLPAMDNDGICSRIKQARPDLLFVSFGCPMQEKWIARNLRSLGVPVAMGVGGTVDMLAGRVRRAPRWMRQTGLEWAFRMMQEPRRLFGRYARDFWMVGCALFKQYVHLRAGARAAEALTSASRGKDEVFWQGNITAANAEEVWQCTVNCMPGMLEGGRSSRVDLSRVGFIDSAGLALMLRAKRGALLRGSELVFAAAPRNVRKAMSAAKVDSMLL